MKIKTLLNNDIGYLRIICKVFFSYDYFRDDISDPVPCCNMSDAAFLGATLDKGGERFEPPTLKTLSMFTILNTIHLVRKTPYIFNQKSGMNVGVMKEKKCNHDKCEIIQFFSQFTFSNIKVLRLYPLVLTEANFPCLSPSVISELLDVARTYFHPCRLICISYGVVSKAVKAFEEMAPNSEMHIFLSRRFPFKWLINKISKQLMMLNKDYPRHADVILDIYSCKDRGISHNFPRLHNLGEITCTCDFHSPIVFSKMVNFIEKNLRIFPTKCEFDADCEYDVLRRPYCDNYRGATLPYLDCSDSSSDSSSNSDSSSDSNC